MIKTVLFYVLYASVSSFGLYKIKISNLSFNGDLYIGGISYVAGFLIWLAILKMNPLSVAFPIAAGSLIIATQLIGFFLLNEQFSIEKIIGIVLIIIGFIFINIKISV